MSLTLPVSRLIEVSVLITQAAAAGRNFSNLLIMGDSDVITGLERKRDYSDLKSIAADFGTSAPEYLAAELYFSQKPQPQACSIGRWLRTATAGKLEGAILNATQSQVSNFSGISNGSLAVTIDGTPHTLSAINLTAVSNLNGVASDVTTALSGAGTCVWNGSQFEIISATTGASSSVGYASATGSGTDLSALMLLQSSQALPLVPGYAAESALAGVTALDALSTSWYGLMFAASTMPSDSDNIAISAFIEADTVTRMFGITIQNTNVLSSEVTNDLASELKALDYEQTFTMYCSSNAYAVASVFGRLFTVNFSGQNTVIDTMYKQMPGLAAESLTTNQANVLQNKRCNVYVGYDNGTELFQYGMMAGPVYIDETYGVDWLQNAIQTACFNVNYTSPTKVPQTDAGTEQFVNAIAQVCQQGIDNGLGAPGTWNSAGFGSLQEGQFLKQGYYIFAPSFATQSESDRAARKSVPIQVAYKLAGSQQQVDVAVTVNQ